MWSIRTAVLVSILWVACGKGGGGRDERRQEAARREDEARKSGLALTVTLRGANDEVMVWKNITVDGRSLCDADFWPTTLQVCPPGQKCDGPDFDVEHLVRVGVKRVECEDGKGAVFGEDIPYTPKAPTAADIEAKRLAAAANRPARVRKLFERFCAETGQRIEDFNINVVGGDADDVHVAGPDCIAIARDEFLRGELRDAGVKSISCISNHEHGTIPVDPKQPANLVRFDADAKPDAAPKSTPHRPPQRAQASADDADEVPSGDPDRWIVDEPKPAVATVPTKRPKHFCFDVGGGGAGDVVPHCFASSDDCEASANRYRSRPPFDGATITSCAERE